jgi:hypothetical protein
LLLVGLVMNSLAAGTRQLWVAWASTNLDNLGRHSILSLVASAFVVEDGGTVAWAAFAVIGLVALGWRLGPWRALVVVASAHSGGTVISEGIVAWQVYQGTMPAEARRLVDVGPSYVVVSALVGAVVIGPLPARLVGAVAFGILAPSLFDGLTELNVAAVGHACSMLIGAGLARAVLPGGAGELAGTLRRKRPHSRGAAVR